MNVSFTTISGRTYPPKNRIAVSELISTIDAYSARKKKTKMMAECSVKNPATSSDSVPYYDCKAKQCHNMWTISYLHVADLFRIVAELYSC